VQLCSEFIALLHVHHGITVVLITHGSGNEVGGRGGVVHHEIQALREEVPLKSRTSLVDESPCQIELERNLLFEVCVCVCVFVFVCVCVCVCVCVMRANMSHKGWDR
jgi:hypothetical protein